jgi:hypothetical protein
MKQFDPPLDDGIINAIETLYDAGIGTYESREGNSGHAYPNLQ